MRIRITELSVVGFRIAHDGRLTPGEERPFALRWDGETIDFVCSVVRSSIVRLSKKSTEKSLYHSGLVIAHKPRGSFEKLRELIADRVMRALDEQKANAHGIPPLAAYMHQQEKGDFFRRCELIGGMWRKSETAHPHQPSHGFTVSAEVSPQNLDLLCRTWESTNAEGRRLTTLLAELSVSRAEGIPTRRFTP
jgi:hypothetical protein